jgi:hypothetical protein
MKHNPGFGYDDLQITALRPRTGGPTEEDFLIATGYSVQAFQFQNDTSTHNLNALTQIPHSWEKGAPIYLHAHLSNNSQLTVGNTVGIFVSVTVAAHNNAFPNEEIYWLSYVAEGTVAAKSHIVTSMVPLSSTLFNQIEYSSLIMLSFFRDKGQAIATQNAGTVTDSLDDVIWFLQGDFHYKQNRIGSPNHSGHIM